MCAFRIPVLKVLVLPLLLAAAGSGDGVKTLALLLLWPSVLIEPSLVQELVCLCLQVCRCLLCHGYYLHLMPKIWLK